MKTTLLKKERLDGGAAMFAFGGKLGQFMERHAQKWIISALDSNPNVLEAIRNAARGEAHKNSGAVAWYGEFSGKFLEGAVNAYRCTGDERVKDVCDALTDEYCKISSDGYLGIYAEDERFCVKNDNWDSWGNYHIIRGLIKWYKTSKNQKALKAAIAAADYMRNYLNAHGGVNFKFSPTMNLALSHAYAELYLVTGRSEDIEYAAEIVKNSWKTCGGNWFEEALDGKPYCQSSLPRWEALHTIETLGILYCATGDEDYNKALKHIWNTIDHYDVHNTGGFTTDETACGELYRNGIIETCCTVAFSALTSEMLRITPDARVASEAERTYYNAMLGSFTSAAYVSYNTPMDAYKHGIYDGRRADSRIDLAFQYRDGSPDFNCCQANAARGLCEIAEWAVMSGKAGIYINYLGDYSCKTLSQSGGEFAFSVKSKYPCKGELKMKIDKADDKEAVFVRIPPFAVNPTVDFSGEKKAAEAGKYYKVTVKQGDVISLEFSIPVIATEGKEQCLGRTSLSYGNVLLGLDEPYETDTEIDSANVISEGGEDICFSSCQAMLRPFATIGRKNGGTSDYRTWLKDKNSADKNKR